MKLKQVLLQVSLSTNVYCDELEDNSDLKIFMNAAAGHWKHCCGPPFAHPWVKLIVRHSFFS